LPTDLVKNINAKTQRELKERQTRFFATFLFLCVFALVVVVSGYGLGFRNAAANSPAVMPRALDEL
jgi:hypothetical protein